MKNDKISVKRFGQDQLQKKKKKWIKPVVIGLVLTVIFAFLTLKGEDLIRSNIVKLSVDNDANASLLKKGITEKSIQKLQLTHHRYLGNLTMVLELCFR